MMDSFIARTASGRLIPPSLRNSVTKYELANAFYRQGVAAFQFGDYRTASAYFVRALRFVPENMMFAQLVAKCSEKSDRRL